MVLCFLGCIGFAESLIYGKESTWWSFVPPKKPDIPANQNAIDFLLTEKLAENQLTFSPETDRSTLVRRLFLVMLGVPPSPEEQKQLAKVEWEKLVDTVLTDPRFGERWAQHWLDIIRWAETVGFETNLPRPNAWPYRDWVIASLNSDLPYDRFILDQLAGDTTGTDAALGFLVAGPANLPGQIGRDEEAMRGARQDELDEVIRTVGQSMFGLTIGCARCHDHKSDPITEKDYYSMQAIFAGLSYGDRRRRGKENDEWTRQVPEVQKQLNDQRDELETLRKKFQLLPPLESVQSETFESQPEAAAIRMKINATADNKPASLYEFEVWSGETNVALASNGATPAASSFALANQTRHFDNLVDGTVDKRQAFPWVAAKGGPAWIEITFAKPAGIDRVVWHRGSGSPADYDIEIRRADSDEWKPLTHSRNRLPRPDDTRKPENIRLGNLSPEDVKSITTLIGKIRSASAKLSRLSAGPQVYGARFSETPETTWVLSRGDAMKRVGKTSPAIPASLGKLEVSADDPEPKRRLALAKHLTDTNHPLTARVMVNRLWQHVFGTGLVETSSDFGKMGTLPSHPELLDLLAVDFVENGWSIRKTLRKILLSEAFQQSSAPNPKAAAIDAEARLLWRFPPRRVEAETIRDSILAVSGKLNPQRGGPGFDFFQQRGGLSDYKAKETFDEAGWRRMIYAHKIRMQSVDIFGAFDCPDAGQMKPRRTRSITPVQSLSLMNSPFANRQAQFFAERIRKDVGENPEVQIERAFAIAYSRKPDADEKKNLAALADEHGLEQVCRVIFNTSEFVFVP